MPEYLDAVIAAFLAHGEKIQGTIGGFDQSLPSVELNDVQRPSIGTTAELCCATLSLISQHLKAIHGLYHDVRVTWGQNTPWSWLIDSTTDPLPEQEAFQHFIKLVTKSKEVSTRIKALTGILYVLNPLDAVEDTEPAGLCDDNFVMATILRELPEQEVPEPLRAWAITVCSNADGCMERSLQESVLSMLKNYVEQLGKH